MSFNPVNPVAPGLATKVDHFDLLMNNTLLLKTGIADDGSIFGPLQGYREKQQTVVINPGTGVVTINPMLGSHVLIDMTRDITSFTIQNVPAADLVYPVILHLKGDGTPRAITWTINTGTVKFPGNAPLAATTGTNNKFDEILICTRDGDTTWEGKILGLNI